MTASLLLVAAFAALPAERGTAQEKDHANDVRVEWGPNHESMTLRFRTRVRRYPHDVMEGDFPTPGAAPKYVMIEEWPVVACRARWTASLSNWPAEYRPEALDLILMYACDAQLYEYIYPGIVLKSHCTLPEEYVKKAKDPLHYKLAPALRGKEIAYEMTATAGFAASDYKIKTKITIGLSRDGKTVFFYDHPNYISEHLSARHFSFAAYDRGDRLQFEGIMVCVCTPRALFKGETLRRIATSGRYFVDRIYKDINEPLTAKDVDEYMKIVRSKYRSLDAIMKRHGYDIKKMREKDKVLP